MRHVTVFQEDSTFAGWPANHGAWQWGDELLFGFIRGRHRVAGMHNVVGQLEKVQARSLDGGETWAVEVPNVDFECKTTTRPPALSLESSIIRVCGNYDHGGEECTKDGGFYLSEDRGRTWHGAYSFGFAMGIKQIGTSRTCVLDDLLFLSAANRDYWGSDFTFCARHDGREFSVGSVVLDDGIRAVMPAVARVRGRIVVALRRRGGRRFGGWIDTVASDDEGQTWNAPIYVGDTGKDNGNPPALIESGGKLFCAFANRSTSSIEVVVSANGAYSWRPHATLRKGNAPDVGYPRLFKRSDGKLVCVYYWTEEYEQAQRIEASIF